MCHCIIAVQLPPMDWVLERTEHKGFLGVTLGDEVFTDLDFAYDVSLLAEMLDVLLLALDIMNQDAQHFGLEINWTKTKIQTIMYPPPVSSIVQVAGNTVEIVGKSTYLGCQIDRTGTSETEVLRRIAITPDCMKSLDRNI